MTSNRWQWDNENIYGETQEHIAPYAPLGAMRNNDDYDDYDDRNITSSFRRLSCMYIPINTRVFFFFYTHLRYLCLCHKSRVSLGKVRKIFTFIF